MPHVLVIEDYPDVQRLMADLLRDAGYTVSVVTNLGAVMGNVSLRVGTPVEVVIASGIGRTPTELLAARVELQALIGPAPVLLCTGLPVTPEAITTAGLAGVITKPFDIEAFVAQVRAVSHIPPHGMTGLNQLAS